MRDDSATLVSAHRLSSFSDAVIAVIMTVLVLELRAPERPAFSALVALWPTAISYAVSYLFIAIIWINHHHLMRFVGRPTLRLIWINFAHLFPVSFLPFATAWVARSRLAGAPVAVYAALFVCIDLAYNVFEREVLEQAHVTVVSPRARRLARFRSLAVLGIFITAALIGFVAPQLGFALVCCGLVPHVKPEPLGSGLPRAVKRTAAG